MRRHRAARAMTFAVAELPSCDLEDPSLSRIIHHLCAVPASPQSGTMPSQTPGFIRAPPAGFSILSIVRGFQLTFLGAYRALQNPDLFREKYYRQALYAVGLSLAIQFAIYVPLWLVKGAVMLVAAIAGMFTGGAEAVRTAGVDEVPSTTTSRAEDVIATVDFIQSQILNLSGLLIGLMRYMRPEMDDMFMESLRFIDSVYFRMHPDFVKQYTRENDTAPSRFYAPLSLYSPDSARYLARAASSKSSETTTSSHSGNISSGAPRASNAARYLSRYLRRAIISSAAYMLSQVPYIGTIILPLISFFSFRRAVGLLPALFVFAFGALYLSKRSLAVFLASYWGARSLCRELLTPYFSRIPFAPEQRDAWFRAREGVLFGFGFGFYYALKVPYVGVLMYGIAEASAAYLVTKVTDPPPAPSAVLEWTGSQTEWTKRKEVLTGSIVHDQGFMPVLPGGWTDTTAKAATSKAE
ncbi:uncharacterized protein V1518DRAFT_415898 [Limtongia smithiae]|uniref:uncharacterized protein n=1 Tax=Limtongia smithiae TaxID=1125753 RepID=UPI0034CDF932